jgi:HEAT repeat protein
MRSGAKHPSTETQEIKPSCRTHPEGIFDDLAKLDWRVAVEKMLDWYRSGNLRKVTMAAHYFTHSDYRREIDKLIQRLRSRDQDDATAAKERLKEIGEPACKKLLELLSDPDLSPVAVEILGEMSGYLSPCLLKAIEKEPLATRLRVFEALSIRRNPDAQPSWARRLEPQNDIGISC